MIKLSDVKVRPQYRTRVRYRLVVLEYAWEHGPGNRPAQREHRSRPRRLSRRAPGDGERQPSLDVGHASARQHEPGTAGITLAADRTRAITSC